MESIEAFIMAAARKSCAPKYEDIFSYCEAVKAEPDVFCNEFSILVARGFYSGKFSFEFCDEAMNYLWGFITTPPVFGPDKDIPQPAFSIYQAFDEGEYHHPGDASEVDPVEKYTRPMITEIIKRLGAS